jgi:hypothetical protein
MFMIGYSTHPSFFLSPPSGAYEIALEYILKAGTLKV